MIIRFCLSFAAKSASAFEELRNSGVLRLPSRRTLRDYRNAIKPKVGFNPAVVEELSKTTSHLEGAQRCVVLAFDEMKIQSKLVFDKHTGQLVGFLDLGDPDINYTAFEKKEELATHILVFYVRGLTTDMKFNFAFFATKCLTSYQIMPIFWRAISILEVSCKLNVIATVSDGAKFLADWKESTLKRVGNYSHGSREKMFMSKQTYEGLQMTTHSVVEATKYLLQERGMEFVLTNRFSQDVVEEIFWSAAES